MFALFSCAYAALVLAPPTSGLDGTYEVRLIEAKGRAATGQDVRTTPPGQIRRFVIDNGYFAVFDMMSAFEGPVAVKGQTVTLTMVEGPAGRLAKPEVRRFAISKEAGKTVLSQTFPSQYPRLRFVKLSDKPLLKLPRLGKK